MLHEDHTCLLWQTLSRTLDTFKMAAIGFHIDLNIKVPFKTRLGSVHSTQGEKRRPFYAFPYILPYINTATMLTAIKHDQSFY